MIESGPRTVLDLARLTGTSPITIRRDLAELVDLGAIRRIRGGAEPILQRGSPYPFTLRADDHREQKEAIARAAAAIVRPGDSVLLDNGTTSIAVARHLSGTGITVMALSLHVAVALASRGGDEILVPGGPVDRDDLAFTSAGAVDAVRAMHYDVALISTCAADPATGLTVERWGDARVKQAALVNARRVVLLATPDKFCRTAAHLFATMGDIDLVITTGDITDDVVAEVEACGPEVTTVPVEPSAPLSA